MHAQALPGFDHGLFSVQDLAGQLVATLLDCHEGQTILDACAAPGSKTCHILETQPNIRRVVAIDIDAERLLRVKREYHAPRFTSRAPQNGFRGRFSHEAMVGRHGV